MVQNVKCWHSLRHHDRIAIVIHWVMCQRLRLLFSPRLDHRPRSARRLENEKPFLDVPTRTKAYASSAIPYLVRILNRPPEAPAHDDPLLEGDDDEYSDDGWDDDDGDATWRPYR